MKRSVEQIQSWMAAAERLRNDVSDDDEVFAAWITLLNNFYQHLPQLLKLSHKALGVKSAYRWTANSLCSLIALIAVPFWHDFGLRNEGDQNVPLT